MQAHDIEDIYTLTPVQEGMLFHVLDAEDPSLYREQGTALLTGDLDVEALHGAWIDVVARHQALRTAFRWQGLRRSVQVVARHCELPFEVLDWRHLDEVEQRAALELALEEDRRHATGLENPPLMNLTLAHLDDRRYRLLWSIHHLIHDAWSLAVILDEVLKLYEGRRQGLDIQASGSRLPPAPPFRAYVSWLKGRDYEQAGPFWRDALADLDPAAVRSPAIEEAGGVEQAPRGAHKAFGYRDRRLSSEATRELEAAARAAGVTLGTLVQGAWALTLGSATEKRRDEVVFGTVVAGRPEELASAQQTVGLFINTLPLRLTLDRSRGLGSWLRELQARIAGLRTWEETPLARIREWSPLAAGAELFEAIVVIQNAFTGVEGRRAAGLEISEVRSVGHPSYPLMLRATPGEGLWLELLHDPARVPSAVAARLLGQVETLLTAFTQAAGLSLAKLLDRVAQMEEETQRQNESRRRTDLGARLRAARRGAPSRSEQPVGTRAR